MHEDFCRDYFTIIHATVVGEAFPFRTQQLPSPEQDLVLEVERLRQKAIVEIQQTMETLRPILERLPQSDQGLKPLLPGRRAHALPWSGGRDASEDSDLTIIDLPPAAIKTRS